MRTCIAMQFADHVLPPDDHVFQQEAIEGPLARRKLIRSTGMRSRDSIQVCPYQG
ncbi:MAG: hypothetical protein R2787_15530 [Saprospiraceae bacterium]